MPENDDTPKSVAWAILCSLVVLGAALRILGIQNESAWWDEYSSLVHLKEPSLWSFLVANRTYDPATLPLYYTIEYLWSCIVGTDTLLLRIPSVLMGLATIPATYLLGAAMLSRRAGLLAAACVAFSPIHIFHAQGIRMYVLFTLLAVLSMCTYVLLRTGNGKRWHHVVAQLFLSWTHPFAVLIPVVQGLGWVFSPSGERKGMFAWGFMTAAAWTPALLYLTTIKYYPQDVTNWIVLPDLQGLFHDLFQDDVVRSGYQLFASDKAWQWLPFGAGALARGMAPAMDWALTMVFLAALPLFAWTTRRQARSNTLLLALWAFAPVLILLAASFLLRPMIAPRYTVHSSIALYLMMAGVLATLPGWRFRCGAAAVCLLLLYQVAWLHPGPQRTNYLGAARAMTGQPPMPGDVLIVTSEFERNILEYNFPENPLHTLHVEGRLLSNLLAFEANAQARQRGESITAWVFHVFPNYDAPAEPGPSDVLPALGLEWHESLLPSIQYASLTRVSMPDNSTADLPSLDGYADLLSNWFLDLLMGTSPVGPKAALANLSPYVLGLGRRANPDLYALYCSEPPAGSPTIAIPLARVHAIEALRSLINGEVEALSGLGEQRIAEVMRLDPGFGLAHFIEGFIHAGQGRPAEALSSMDKACALDSSARHWFGDYVAALHGNNLEQATEAASRIRIIGPEDPKILTGIAEGIIASRRNVAGSPT